MFQKRQDGSVDFYRDWTNYKNGFGNLNDEFWLGLDKIYRLANSDTFKLRVDLEDWDEETRYAEYASFAISDEASKYKLSLGSYSGTTDCALHYITLQSHHDHITSHHITSHHITLHYRKVLKRYTTFRYTSLHSSEEEGGGENCISQHKILTKILFPVHHRLVVILLHEIQGVGNKQTNKRDSEYTLSNQ